MRSSHEDELSRLKDPVAKSNAGPSSIFTRVMLPTHGSRSVVRVPQSPPSTQVLVMTRVIVKRCEPDWAGPDHVPATFSSSAERGAAPDEGVGVSTVDELSAAVASELAPVDDPADPDG